MCLIREQSEYGDSDLNKSTSLWWRFFAAYDQTVNHTSQVRRTMEKLKSQYREQAEAQYFYMETQCGKTTRKRKIHYNL